MKTTTIDMSNFAPNTRKFTAALLKGTKITPARAKRTYNIPNPSATVFHLRNRHGLNVVSTTKGYALAA
jgi:hypothetical protein